MRRSLISALAAATLPAHAGENSWRDGWSGRGVNIGASAVAEMLYASGARNWPARLDLSTSIELDLGTLTGWPVLDHTYAFALPTLAWGEEEEWHWRARLYVAWLKWDGSEKWNVLAGLYDPTWDFHALPSTAPFVRLPSRVGGEFSPGSPGLLDLYPLAAPGVRIEVTPTRHVTFQAAALSLDAEYELHGRPALASDDPGRRPLILGEVAWRTLDEEAEDGGHFHTGLGGWFLSGQTSWGVYAFADATLWQESGDDEQGCSTFASGSVAGGEERDEDWRCVAGVTWRGLFPQRNDDITATAIIREKLGDGEETRTAWEILHRVPLTGESWLQLTVQHQGRGDWRIGFTVGCEL